MAKSPQKGLVSIGGLDKGLLTLEKRLKHWSKDIRRQLTNAHRRIGQRHRSEAVKRVPVDTSRLKQAILTNTFVDEDEIVTETGTNVQDYPVLLEFGTPHIAGGRVLSVGDSPLVTDAEAITTWPAKNNEIVDPKTGKVNARLAGAIQRRAERGGAQEQMPWLRPSFNAIREWAIQQIDNACLPPEV